MKTLEGDRAGGMVPPSEHLFVQPELLYMRLLVLLPVLLTSCSGVNAAEQACRAAISDQLLNPESAKFFDFAEISADDFKSISQMNILARAGMAAPKPEVDAQLAAVDRYLQDQQREGWSFYSVRVQAQGRLGNVITQKKVCSTNNNQCVCADIST